MRTVCFTTFSMHVVGIEELWGYSLNEKRFIAFECVISRHRKYATISDCTMEYNVLKIIPTLFLCSQSASLMVIVIFT